MSSENDFLNQLWENWRARDGMGHCDGCPAHWSVRDDYPGNSDSRTSSCGHRPFYGDGEAKNPDIAIFGHEPGNDFDHGPDSDPDQFGPNYTEYTFDEARSEDVTKVPAGSNSIEDVEPLFTKLNEDFSVYWSQVKKCNQLEDSQDNEIAANQCKNYLREELRATDPDYVISLGKQPYLKFIDVFDIEDPGSNFARAVGAGDRPSGFQPLAVEGESFVYIPVGHPSYGIHHQTTDQLDLSGADNETEYYFELIAQDLVRYIHQSE